MKAYIFPGQGAQFSGMGLPLYEGSALAKSLFEEANDILGFNITKIMFEGSVEDLRETKVTQPAKPCKKPVIRQRELWQQCWD